MFAKPIDRDLQGVIIVGQDETANVKQELGNTLSQGNCRNILQISLWHIRQESLAIHQKPVYGFPVSLDVVNLIS